MRLGAANGIAPEVLFFIDYEQDLLHQFDPQSKERAFPIPRTWEFVSNIAKRRNGLDAAVERAPSLDAAWHKLARVSRIPA